MSGSLLSKHTAAVHGERPHEKADSRRAHAARCEAMTIGHRRLRLTHGLSGYLRLAARRQLSSPLFTVFAVLSLAIGVAVTTAVYSIVDSLLLRNSGIRDPGQVVFVVSPYQGRLLQGSISEPDFVDLRAAQT